MKTRFDGVRFRWAAGVACCVALAAVPAWGQTAGTQDTVTQLPDSAAAVTPPGTIQELQQRIQNHEMAELRTTYNGTYGTSLLFYPPDMTYYIALFHQKQFWRVVKAGTEKRAEAVYRDFTKQTALLAETEIRRIQLEAQKNTMEKQVAENEARLAAVQNDLAIQRQQEQQLAQNQQDVRNQAAALDAERTAARQRLDGVQGQIRALEKEQNSSNVALVKQVRARR